MNDHLIESLNYAVMYYTDLCTRWLLYAYVFKRKIRSIVLINLKLLFCRSSCHQSFTHFIFICLRTLLHKTVECGHGSYVEAKKTIFTDVKHLNISVSARYVQQRKSPDTPV